MSRALVCVCVFLGFAANLGAQVLAASAYVDSTPIGARVVVDGTLTELRTPALLRGMTPGRHTISLWKSGYVQVTQYFTAADGKVPQVKANLPPLSVVVTFPANDQISSAGGTLPTVGRQFRFPSGTYNLSGFDNAARMTPVFPDSDLTSSAGWSLLLSLSSMAASGLADYDQWRRTDRLRVSQLTFALGVSAATDLVWLLTLEARKSKFYRETAPQITPEPQRLDQAPSLFNQGEDALQSGDLAAAEGFFSRVVSDYPDSGFVPGSWFRLAKLHSVTGKRELALGEYRLVAGTFPQAAYHDRARQAITDLYEASGNPELALENLNQMVLVDGFFDVDAVEAQRARLQSALDAASTPEAKETAAETPRQGYQRVLELFALGHDFSAAEITGFADLKARLSELGDTDLVLDLNLLQRALSAASSAAETADTSEWTKVSSSLRDRESWIGVRNAGVGLLGFSTAGTLLAAALYDRSPSESMIWTVRGGMGSMALSLFPLLWAEPRQ